MDIEIKTGTAVLGARTNEASPTVEALKSLEPAKVAGSTVEGSYFNIERGKAPNIRATAKRAGLTVTIVKEPSDTTGETMRVYRLNAPSGRGRKVDSAPVTAEDTETVSA